MYIILLLYKTKNKKLQENCIIDRGENNDVENKT